MPTDGSPTTPQHDLAGLEAFMQMLLALEAITTQLSAWCERYQDHLSPGEEYEVRTANRALFFALHRLHNREDHNPQ